MNTYKGWELLETMPEGWKLDKTAGSPLLGYSFVTNGKSVLNGQLRALLRVVQPQMQICYEEQSKPIPPQGINKEKEPSQIIDAKYPRTVNELAREKFKRNLLNDILVDLTICEIEGWCKSEYIKELKDLICSLGNKAYIDVVCSKIETTT